ncbi:hypothetical protein V1281_002598 [Nitrobacteraceae bacterium AZCC 2161]
MGLFSISGTIASIGQSTFNESRQVYAFIEIVDGAKNRFMVERVVVSNDINSNVSPGLQGVFFFDQMHGGAKFKSQLWGVKSSNWIMVDRQNIRKWVNASNIICGTLLLPLFGVGLISLLPALSQVISARTGKFDRIPYFDRHDDTDLLDAGNGVSMFSNGREVPIARDPHLAPAYYS